MGNIDATVPSIGAQIANDVLGGLRTASKPNTAIKTGPSGERSLMVATQIAMAVVTVVSAAIACLPLPAMFKIGLFAIQVMVQLSVPLYLGIFTKLGNAPGAIAGMLAGVLTVCVLQYTWPRSDSPPIFRSFSPSAPSSPARARNRSASTPCFRTRDARAVKPGAARTFRA